MLLRHRRQIKQRRVPAVEAMNWDQFHKFSVWFGWAAVVGLVLKHVKTKDRRGPAKLLRGAEWATPISKIPLDVPLDGAKIPSHRAKS